MQNLSVMPFFSLIYSAISFANSIDLSALVDERVRGIQVVPLDAKQAGRNVKIENPLLRSGIALAGANNALRFGGTERSTGL